MRALIVLENHFYYDSDGNVWCDRVVDYNYLCRYLKVFDDIVVMGRTQKIKEKQDEKLLVSGKNVSFVPLPDFRGSKGLLKNIIKIKKIIRIEIKKCDCVIYRAPTHLSLFTYKEVLKQNKVLALEFMMSAEKMFDGSGIIKKSLNRIIDFLAKKMCLRADCVSYVTEHVLQEKYPCINKKNKNIKKITSSYSSIDLPIEMYYQQKWKEDISPKTFNIIHTGYMDSYRKGQDVLIKAFKIVYDKGYNVTLTLIGDGEKKREFEELSKKLNVSDNIDFVGIVKDKHVLLKYLRKSHLLVFPTQSEGLPRTIIEGMSQGLVCISSPVDGIPELLDEEFLVNYDDVNGYAAKIMECINNWKKCCMESKKNYEKSLKYEKSHIDKIRTDFYQKIVSYCNTK